MKKLFPLVFLLIPFLTAPAQIVTFSGQVRERSEFDNRNFSPNFQTDVFHLLRARLKATAMLNGHVGAVVEVQDAREFGGNSTTHPTLNNGAPAFDLRQAYIAVMDSGMVGVQAKLGRQVLSFANERLIGAIDWNNFGQSFDALSVRLSKGEATLDLFGAAVVRYPNTGAEYMRDVFLTGAWAAWHPTGYDGSLQAYWLFDTPKPGLNWSENRHTAGLYTRGATAGFDYELDGAIQFGDYIIGGTQPQTLTIKANMFGARVGYTFANFMGLRIGAGIDRLSGSDPNSTTNFTAFSTLYATNHKFYGFMDYFTVFPNYSSGTAFTGYGLQDIIAQVSIAPSKTFACGADFHLFSTVSDPKDFNPAYTGTKSIGMELDLTASVKIYEAVNLTCGLSMFDAERDRAVLGSRKTTNWLYAMTTVNL